MKPGPGRSPEDVAAHQCGRLQAALIELVAEQGYNAVTVAALVDRAGVSKRDFYKHFAGKESCFIATYDLVVEHSVDGILAAADGEEEWCERLRLGFLAFAGQIANRPEAAQLALVEVFAAGADAIERMFRTSKIFEALLAKSFALAEGDSRLPPLVIKGIVAGGARVARARLLAGDPRQLTLDGGELTEWALSFCDDAAVRLRGLGGLPPAPLTVVEAPPRDERALILAATARLTSGKGYAALTVPQVRAAAGVSKRSFDAHFDGVADCFLATVDLLSGRTLAAALPTYLDADDWASGVHRVIATLCRHLAHDPAFARLAFLEVLSPGAEAVRWRTERIARLARRLHRGAEGGSGPSVFAAEASVGAMWGVIHHFVATGRVERLPTVAPVLSYLALAPALGAPAAVEVILAEAARDSGEKIAVAAPRA